MLRHSTLTDSQLVALSTWDRSCNFGVCVAGSARCSEEGLPSTGHRSLGERRHLDWVNEVISTSAAERDVVIHQVVCVICASSAGWSDCVMIDN